MHSTLCILALFLMPLASAVYSGYQNNDGNKYAVITNGNIDDMGWSALANAGRVSMERTLNLSGTIFVPHVETPAEALTEIARLAGLGVRLIVSATNSHGTALAQAAAIYPGINFVSSGGRSTLPNYSSMGFAGTELFFVAGVFCGVTSPTGVVGFVHPGPPAGPLGTINAFYAGVRYGNPNATLHVVYMGNYLDPDAAQGAADLLLNPPYSVTALSSHQDDNTVSLAAMAGGLLGVGITGFSLRSIYGEQVGMSIIRDWGLGLSVFGKSGLNGTAFKYTYSGSFANGGQTLDEPSHLVSAADWSVVTGVYDILKTGKTLYYCVPGIYDAWGLNPTTGCLKNTSLFSQRLIPGINLVGKYAVPLERVRMPHATSVALIAVSAVLIAVLALGVAFLFAYRGTEAVLGGSPFFMRIMLVGCAIVYAGAITWALDPTVSVCRMRIWLPSIGACIAVGALLIKNVRLQILYQPARAYERKEYLHNYNLLAVLGGLVLVDALLLSIRAGLGADEVVRSQGIDGLTKYQVRDRCDSSNAGNALLYAILAYHAAQLLFGCVLSYKLREVNAKRHDERGAVSATIYMTSVCLVIIVALILGADLNDNSTIIIVVLGLLIATTGAVVVVIGSKVVAVFGKSLDSPVLNLVGRLRSPRADTSSTAGGSATASASTRHSATIEFGPPGAIQVAQARLEVELA